MSRLFLSALTITILFSLSITQKKCFGNVSVCICKEVQGDRAICLLSASCGPGTWPCVEVQCYRPQEQCGKSGVAQVPLSLMPKPRAFRSLYMEVCFRRN